MERKVSVKLPFELIILKKEREPWMSMVQSCGSFHRRQLRHSHIRAYRQTSKLPTAPPPQPPRALAWHMVGRQIWRATEPLHTGSVACSHQSG